MERDVCALCKVMAVLGLIASLGAALFLGLLLIPPYNSSHAVMVPTTSAALLFFVGISLFSRAKARGLQRPN